MLGLSPPPSGGNTICALKRTVVEFKHCVNYMQEELKGNHKTRIVERAISTLQKEFVLVGKRRVRGWHAWLLIGIVFGVALGIILVAERTTRFPETEALPPAISSPNQLRATTVSTNSIDLFWRENNKSENGHEIERSLKSGDYAKVGTVGTNVTAFSDKDLDPNTNYAYRVRAFQFVDGGIFYSPRSNVANATTLEGTVILNPDISAPSVPTGLSASPLSRSEISLSWNASTDDTGVLGYRVFRDNVLVIKVSLNSFIDRDLASSTIYTYQISAYDIAGNVSAKSDPAQATTLAQ